MRFGPSQLSCLGSSVGRALCLEYRVSWVRVPPEAAHFFLGKVTALGVLCCFALFVRLTCLLLSFFLLISHLKTCTFVYANTCTHSVVSTCTCKCYTQKHFRSIQYIFSEPDKEMIEVKADLMALLLQHSMITFKLTVHLNVHVLYMCIYVYVHVPLSRASWQMRRRQWQSQLGSAHPRRSSL